MYSVYVKTDDRQRIVAINSSAFLEDVTGWVKIDEGMGDKYHHAQGNYFPLPVVDDRGIPRYKLVGEKPIERTASELDADCVEPEPMPTPEERISQLEEALALLLSGVTE